MPVIEMQCLLHSLYFSVSFKFLKIQRSLWKEEYVYDEMSGGKQADYTVVTGVAHTFHCIHICTVWWKKTFRRN